MGQCVHALVETSGPFAARGLSQEQVDMEEPMGCF